MLLPVLLVLAAASADRPFAEERQLLDRRLEALRRVLPDGAQPAADVAHLRSLLEAARISRFDVLARPPVETGGRGEVVVDVTALAPFLDIERFFRQAALSPRLIDVESLTLTSTSEQVVRATAVMRLPFHPARAGAARAVEGLRAPSDAPRPLAEAFLRDQGLALAKTEAIAARRRERRNPRLFLSELAAAVRDRPVVLGYAALADEFVLRGLAVGEGTVRALESRLERGFFRLTGFLMARQGACHRFEVRGRSPVAGMDAELPVPSDDPFLQDEQPCQVDRDEARTVTVRAAPARKGPLALRLRGVDLADVFLALHLLTGEAFVVEAGVAGRASVELSGVTLEDALTAIARAGDLDVGAGPIRRVAPRPAARTAPAPSPAPEAGPPVRFLLKRASVRDVLAVMAEADPTLAALGPAGFVGRLSVFARDVPVGALRQAVLESARLVETIEEGRRVLARAGSPPEEPVPVASSGARPRLVLPADQVALLEFSLAGAATAGDGWLGFAYAPTGALHAYRAGDRLHDAVVRSVDSTDVLLDSEEGPLRVLLPPMR